MICSLYHLLTFFNSEFFCRVGTTATAERATGRVGGPCGYNRGPRGGMPAVSSDSIKSQVCQTGNEKDVTMQAGRQKAVLPLIRKFNEHSERLLNSALWVAPLLKQLS